jgi:hypothetical protein
MIFIKFLLILIFDDAFNTGRVFSTLGNIFFTIFPELNSDLSQNALSEL